MKLRVPYQQEAHDRTLACIASGRKSPVIVMPTGTGKTVVFARLLESRAHLGRGMVIAHRTELIQQAVDKIHRATSLTCDVEQAQQWSNTGKLIARTDVVVASIQTLNGGGKIGRRMYRFDPKEFATLVIDEVHHAVAESYRRIIDFFRKGNPDIVVIGVSATPRRTDGVRLKGIFDSNPYTYSVRQAITDGWLVDAKVIPLHIDSVDLSLVGEARGDLKVGELERQMLKEKALYGVSEAVYRESRGRKTLMFVVGVEQARLTTQILNNWSKECARYVTGKTQKDDRAELFADYSAGRYQFLVNVGVATEGYDEWSIQCIALARPTQSTSLLTQMVGRGTRTEGGLVDRYDTAEERRAAIAASSKPVLTILDICGVTGQHKLAHPADVLGGDYPPEVLDRAQKNIERAKEPQTIGEECEKAAAEIRAERDQREQMEMRSRARIRANVQYRIGKGTDIFNTLDIKPDRTAPADDDRELNMAQQSVLRKNGIKPDGYTLAQALQLLEDIARRRRTGQCSPRQIVVLRRAGYTGDYTKGEAGRLIVELKENGWKRPEKKVAG